MTAGAGRPGAVASVAATAAQVRAAGRRAAERGGLVTARGGRWAHEVMLSAEPPRIPAAGPWRMAIGTLMLRGPRVPSLVRKVLGLLDRFGAVRFGPDSVGFDADDVAWDKVVEVRVRGAYDMLTAQALDREVDRLKAVLPPLPGRKRLVTAVAETLATVALAALEQGSGSGSESELGELTVPSEIVYRGLLGRERTLSGGLFAVAVLTVVEPARTGLLATARAHGIPVTGAAPLPEASRAARTAALRERTAALSQRLRTIEQAARAEDAQDSGDPEDPEDAQQNHAESAAGTAETARPGRPGPPQHAGRPEHPEHTEHPAQ